MTGGPRITGHGRYLVVGPGNGADLLAVAVDPPPAGWTLLPTGWSWRRNWKPCTVCGRRTRTYDPDRRPHHPECR